MVGVRGSCPRGSCPGVVVLGGCCPRGSLLGVVVLGGSRLWRVISGGGYPGDRCPRTIL